MTNAIRDQVPADSAGAREIGFAVPEQYNASRVLFDNLAVGRGNKLALIGPAGTRTYSELCAEACRWGNGFASLGLKRGDRRLLMVPNNLALWETQLAAIRIFREVIFQPEFLADLIDVVKAV